MSNKFFYGSSILHGNGTVPGVPLPDELKKLIPTIFKECKDYGLDYYPTIVQMLSYDEISEIASYGGFPVRYPHWKWGMEYEELQRGYEYGMHRIFEMVVNCLHPDTKIPTNKGSIEAKHVKEGDKVFSNTGEKLVAKVIKQEKSKTFKIKLRDQIRDLVCTENHKWLTLTENGNEWKETKDLKPNDLLIGGNIYNYFLKTPCQLNTSFAKEMSLELAEFLGAFYASNPILNNDELSINFESGDKAFDKLTYILKFSFELFNSQVKILMENNLIKIFFTDSNTLSFFNFIGLFNKIPDVISLSSNEYRAAFLRGYFSFSAKIKKDNKYILHFTHIEKTIASDLQLVLAEFGIYTVAKEEEGNFFEISICGKKNLISFLKYINLFFHKKDAEMIIFNYEGYSYDIKSEIIQNKVLKTLNKINNVNFFINNISSIDDLRKNPKNLRFIEAFLENNFIDYHVKEFEEILQYFSNLFFQIESINEDVEQETIDIALFDENHDFMANGVISHNTNPCYIYCLNSNTLVDNVTVIAHALGHNHFFKNNIYFSPTSQNMMNEFANNGTRIKKYMARYGKEKVTEFIDCILKIDTLIDPAKAWENKTIKDPIIKDEKKYIYPTRIKLKNDRLHLDPWINSRESIEKENKLIKEQEAKQEIGLFQDPTKDILGYIRDNANLKPWQRDIVSILYEEALYFYPQGMTKTCNEGCASFIDYQIMARNGLVGLGQKSHDDGIIEYAKHKMSVLGGKYSMNPYKLGFYLLLDIEERWNKGKFGKEYDECQDANEKEKWDKNLGLGKEKVFEIWKYYDDVNFINEFFTPEFCKKNEFFEWEKHPNGEYVISSKDSVKIKRKLMQKHLNRGLPEIKLIDPNHKNKGYYLLEHAWDGRVIYQPYVGEVLSAIFILTGKPVVLTTKNKNNEDIVYVAPTKKADDLQVYRKEEYFKKWNMF
jgi:stage V sporulation protein R